MIKLFIKLLFVSFLVCTPLVHATLITPQDESTLELNVDYIQLELNGIDYDIVWASSVNSQRWHTSLSTFNTLFAPSYYNNSQWSYAGLDDIPDLLTIFNGRDIYSLFYINQNYVHAFSHWNSIFNNVTNDDDINVDNVRSTWSWFVPDPDIDLTVGSEVIAQQIEISESGATADTFYVRKSSAPVPEPSTLMIFALGLIALASKKRLFSSK